MPIYLLLMLPCSCCDANEYYPAAARWLVWAGGAVLLFLAAWIGAKLLVFVSRGGVDAEGRAFLF